jgi:UDP-N-acetylglucosamine diphosphorylase/glucosamine-1-phosphate N-acetyltransferase
MATVIYLFEDHTYRNFYPLTYNRPVYELLFGMMKLREKVALHFPNTEIRLLCRDFLQLLLEKKTKLKVNDFNLSKADRILLLNGRAILDSTLVSRIDFDQEKSYWHKEELVAVILTAEKFKKHFESIGFLPDQPTETLQRDLPAEQIAAKLLNYLWDFVSGNPDEISRDFQLLKPRLNFKHMFDNCSVDQQAVIYKPENVYIGRNTKIEAFAVLNAENGPIYIDDDCTIQAFTRIEGPAYIGKNTQIFGAKISGGCSFGPVSRLGGEIQQSIFLGYSNKYHEGFLGHSYLGEWVNLGAGTTNSDLKNNYSAVRLSFPDKQVDTGQSKVGSFIGDHVKTGIGTLLNTGAYIGIGANIFGGGMIRSKFIPSFAWGNAEGLHEYAWDKFIETAKVVMQRRNVELLNSEKEILKKIFELTKPERETNKSA